MSVNEIHDLEKTINDIWKYCTNEWLRLCIDDGLENKSRRKKMDLFWIEIQSVRFHDGNFAGINRFVDKSRVPNEMILIPGCLGYLSSYAAKNRIKDMDIAMTDFNKKAYVFLNSYLRKIGIPANSRDHFKSQVELKMKKFNIRPEEEK